MLFVLASVTDALVNVATHVIRESWRHNLDFVDYVALAVIVLGIVYLILRRMRSGSDGPTPDAVS
jgi:hypothetical protein